MNDKPTPSQLVYSLWEAGNENFAQAAQVQVQLASVADALKSVADGLPTAMAKHLDAKLPDAAGKAAQMIASKWTAANDNADRAAEAYRRATADARKMLYGATTLMLLIIAAVMLGFGVWILPKWDQVAQMRIEQAQLEATLQRLSRQGGLDNVQSCRDKQGLDRLCVRVDESAKVPAGLRVIKGY